MTYFELKKMLSEAGIAEAGEEAALLLTHCAGVPAHELIFRRSEDFDTPALRDAVRRRLTREPLQYIFGSWSFCGLEFSLNADTLIPRPDTELTVEEAVKLLPEGAVFADVGTGSGAIAVSVLSMRPDTRGYGIDISPGALEAARTNALANGVGARLTLLHADALDGGFADLLLSLDPPPAAILSNPPYIPSDVIPTLAPELAFEPHRALDGGSDGLIFYRAITAAAKKILPPGGLVIFEVGIGESEDVRAIGREAGFDCAVRRDLGGIERTVILRKK